MEAGYDNALKHVAVVRWNSDGMLDTTFDGDGVVTLDPGVGFDAYGRSVTVQPDGKLLVTGEVYNGSDYDLLANRFNTDGSLDTGFGVGGILIDTIGSSHDRARGNTVQPDGTIRSSGPPTTARTTTSTSTAMTATVRRSISILTVRRPSTALRPTSRAVRAS